MLAGGGGGEEFETLSLSFRDGIDLETMIDDNSDNSDIGVLRFSVRVAWTALQF
jgi:hypothetical protein